jgi:mercuric ion transport protein
MALPAPVPLHRSSTARTVGTASGLLAAGGVVGGVLASSCCILPLALFGLGVSGAWIGNLTALAPYQPIFIAFALVSLAAGFWRVYRRPAAVCAEGGACGRPTSSRLVKGALWTAAVLIVAAITFDYTAPFLLS